MEIKISSQALKWYKEDLGFNKGDNVRFYVQFYGNSPVQQGFSLAFTEETPIKIAVSTELEGILFYIEESDLWYFDDHDLLVEYDPKEDELEYKYVKL